MTALFVALGIAVLTLLALLLWFVPHLLHQQAVRSAQESARLRDMLLDMLNEQEAVTLRQSQLSTSIAYLQDQLEHLVTQGREEGNGNVQVMQIADPAALKQLEDRISAMQAQIQVWIDQRVRTSRTNYEQDNEAWAYLLSLLSAIQERVGELATNRNNAQIGLQARTLVEELDQEMQQLRAISEDIATLQWRLRRSLNERENNMSVLRAHSSGNSR